MYETCIWKEIMIVYGNLLFADLIYFVWIHVSYKYSLWEFVHFESKLTLPIVKFECVVLPNFNYIY